jgi:cell division protein FtsW
MMSRAERTPFTEWWWTIDRLLLFSFIALMVIGIVLSLAASPPVAERIGVPLFHFVDRQALFLLPSAAAMGAISFCTTRQVRQLALLVFLGAFAMMAATLVIGPEIKGAHRWISVGSLAIEPSEFVKPSFVVIAAWLFAEGAQRRDVPGHLFSMVLFAAVVGVLVMQPDFGQTLLISLVWAAMFFMAGLRLIWMIGLGGIGFTGLLVAYKLVAHVRIRIDHFLSPDKGPSYQTERAMESFLSGGWFGKGPGEGTVKRILPDAHTDFIFAVTGEEFGIIACLLLLALFGLIVMRGLHHALREDDGFVRLATAGLTMLFGLQAAINMAVNVHLMPAKGMTLPFISYGGSSLLSLAFGVGMLLALTRTRPRAIVLSSDRAEPDRALGQPV